MFLLGGEGVLLGEAVLGGVDGGVVGTGDGVLMS